MRKYKFVLMLSVIVAVFFVLSWFVYDGIDIFFDLVYSPTKEKTDGTKTTDTQKSSNRTPYKTKEANKEILYRDDTVAPDTRYIKNQRDVQRGNIFEKFIIKIFPKQLDYVLNPYTFFLLLVFSVLPIIGIFAYLIIYYFR